MNVLKDDTAFLEICDQQIFYWHLELSSKCTLKCPRCPRTLEPGKYKITEMNLDFVKKILPSKRLFYVKKILLNGGQGDPVYCRDFIEIIRYFKETNSNIKLCITTNGSYKKRDWWIETAGVLKSNDSVTFSVDGWDQKSNEQYRMGSNFESIMEGMRTLREYNKDVFIIWSAIIFKFNQNRMNDIRDLAEKMGVNAFNVVQSRLFGSVNRDYIDPELGYDPLEPDKDFIEKGNTNRGFYVSFKKRTFHGGIGPSVFKLIKKYQNFYKDSYILPLCRIGERGLYVDAEGILYPCSWISHPFGVQVSKKRKKSIHWEKSLFVEHKNSFDLNKNSLEDVIRNPLWKKLQCSWLDSRAAFVECEKHCNRENSIKKIATLNSKSFYNEKSVLETVGLYKKQMQKKTKEMEKVNDE